VRKPFLTCQLTHSFTAGAAAAGLGEEGDRENSKPCTLADHSLSLNAGAGATGLGKEVVETNSGVIGELILGGTSFGPLRVALVDFLHINHEYSRFSDKKIVGLIGSDFLYARRALIDFDQTIFILDAD
jgi:hypothetical protein